MHLIYHYVKFLFNNKKLFNTVKHIYPYYKYDISKNYNLTANLVKNLKKNQSLI